MSRILYFADEDTIVLDDSDREDDEWLAAEYGRLPDTILNLGDIRFPSSFPTDRELGQF